MWLSSVNISTGIILPVIFWRNYIQKQWNNIFDNLLHVDNCKGIFAGFVVISGGKETISNKNFVKNSQFSYGVILRITLKLRHFLNIYLTLKLMTSKSNFKLSLIVACSNGLDYVTTLLYHPRFPHECKSHLDWEM